MRWAYGYTNVIEVEGGDLMDVRGSEILIAYSRILKSHFAKCSGRELGSHCQ